MRRILCLFCGTLAAFLVFVVGAVALIVASPFGNRLLLDQSERLAAIALPESIAIAIGSRSVGFAPSGKIGLRYADVVLTERVSGTTLASVAELSIGFSLFDLLTGDLAADSITATKVTVDPAVFSDGDLGPPNVEAIFAGLDQAVDEVADLPIEAIAISDLRFSPGGSAAAWIERLQVGKTGRGELALALTGTVDGTSVGVTGSALPLPGGGGLQGLSLRTDQIDLPVTIGPDAQPSLSLTVGLDGQKGERRLTLAATTAVSSSVGDRIDGNISANIKEGRDVAEIAVDFSDGSEVSAAFAGLVDLAASQDGRIPFEFASTRLVSSIASSVAEPGASLERTASFRSVGSVDLQTGEVRLDEARLDAGGGWLAATAALSGTDPDDRLQATFQAGALSAEDLLAFWPFFVADGPRGWAMEHLQDGAITAGKIALNLTIDRFLSVIGPNEPMRDDELEVQLAFSGGGFTTLPEMPAIFGAAGSIHHRGDRAVISLDGGKIAGMPELAILSSSLEFQHAGDGTDGALSLNVEGAADDLLRLAEHEPIIASAIEDWEPEDFAGKARVGVGTAFHLSAAPEAVPGSEVSGLKWTVFAELKGVDVNKPIEGRRFSGLTGTAMIAEASAMGEFTGKIDGIAADVTFTQPIGPDPVGEASLKISASLDDGDIAKLSPALSGILKGPVAAELTRKGDGFAARLDLTKAAIALPAIGWSKSAGVAGVLSFSARKDGAAFEIADAVLDGDGFSARGSAELDDAGLKSMVLDSLALNRGDSVSARLTRIDGGIGVSVAANSIDARPMLAALQEQIDGSGEDETGEKERLRVELVAERLVGFNGETMQDAAIRYEASGEQVRGATLAGAIGGAPISMTFDPAAKDAPALLLETRDAGAVLRFSGLYGKMKGGFLRARLGTRDGAFAGQVVLTEFTLADEERLRRLVGTAQQRADSLAARLGRDLPVANAYFDTARATLLWKNGRLILDDGIIRGPVFGSSFAGTLIDPSGRVEMAGSFMPAYGVNRLFGALPFVGGVLGNGGEGGLIGITYRLDGLLSDPTLTVNPISLIAPGIFRRIFEY